MSSPREQLPDEEREPVPVALELEHHERIAGLAGGHRGALSSVLQTDADRMRMLPTPESLLPLAERFAAASDSQVDMGSEETFGLRFSYHLERYNDNREFQSQQLVSELRALGIGSVERVDFSGNVSFLIPLAGGGCTEWFFAATREPLAMRRLSRATDVDGNPRLAAYRLVFHEETDGGRYAYWQPPGLPPLRQALEELGRETVDGDDGFFVSLDDGHYAFQPLPEDPVEAGIGRDERIRAGYRRVERIAAALPPVPAGRIRMYRGIIGTYEERVPLTEEEVQEFLRLRSNLAALVADETAALRFAELYGRATGQMATPDLADVLHQYAVGPDASLLYADVTLDEMERYRDHDAPASILSGYTTFPPGVIRWHAVALRDIEPAAEGQA